MPGLPWKDDVGQVFEDSANCNRHSGRQVRADYLQLYNKPPRLKPKEELYLVILNVLSTVLNTCEEITKQDIEEIQGNEQV